MSKIYGILMTLVVALCVGLNVQAQAIIDEGFENTQGTSATEVFPDGWTRQNTYAGNHVGWRWTIGYSENGTTMSGHYYAYCDAPTSLYNEEMRSGKGPREEILFTPELDLDGTYKLTFDWEAAAYSVLSQGNNTLQVAVFEGETKTIILDITNEQQVRDSGVPADPYGSYIWGNWMVNTSQLDLSPWAGKKVKIGFIHKLIKEVGNIIYLDNIKVEKSQQITTPIAEASQSEYRFGTTYIGEKFYSEQMTIKNVGLKGLKVLGFEAPECIGLVMDTESVDLNLNETAPFKLSYTASLTSPTEADAIIKTNGGDVKIHITVDKQAVPDGYTLELFEGKQFPPAGWSMSTGVSQWSRSSYITIEGDLSMNGSPFISSSWINTPKIDLSDPNAPHDFKFTYFAYYYGEEEIPSNDLEVYVSQDGGETFSKVWTADYTVLNELVNVSIDLSAYSSAETVVRFVNTECYYDSEYGMDDASTFIIDRVLLPNLAGQNDAPGLSELIAPADEAVDIYPKNVVLSWTEAQFAEGYKLYLGTSAEAFDVLDGEDLGTATTYTIAAAEGATTYYWKVVPYNGAGDAEGAATWSFTTQPIVVIAEFPWIEGFEGESALPVGWFTQATSLTKWTRSDYYPFNGSHSMMAWSRNLGEEAILATPDVKLPATGDMHMSFWWGNDAPVSLIHDTETVRLNTTTGSNGRDITYFEIFADGEWTTLSTLSDPDASSDDHYWFYEPIDLSEYAGKTVQFRWRYTAMAGSADGAALDDVKIEAAGAEIAFNVDGWSAYRVNADQPETSPVIAASNLGSNAVQVSGVSFNDAAFSTSLEPGTEIAGAGSVTFTVTFDAKGVATDEPVEVEDALTITFSDGSEATLPVSAIALPADFRYYGFEHDATGVVPAGFVGIDVDSKATSPLTFWDFPNNGTALSFFVLNDSQCYNSLKEPHGHQSLMTRCNTEGTFEDWIVTADQVEVGENTKFEFDMRNWESVTSVLPAGCPTVSVLVSTTSATDRNSFTQVGSSFTPELYNNVSWDHLSYDLSEYAGQKVFVALKSVATECLGAFYDNFEFQHVKTLPRGDVNGDGVVSAADLAIVVNILAGLDDPDNYAGRANVNGDKYITAVDIAAIVNILAGLE